MKGSFKERLDEIDEKYRKPEKKKKKKQKRQSKPSGLNGLLHGFNEQQAKGNGKITLLKTFADLAGVGLGTAVSAAAGKVAPLLGVAMIGAGHYIGDDSGLLRVVGAATVAHSVAKSKEYRQEGSTMMKRLSGVKDDWLRLAMLNHEEQKTPAIATPIPKTSVKVEPIPNPVPIPISQPAERRKTPYEQEIEQRQREIEEEAERLRAELAELDGFGEFDSETDEQSDFGEPFNDKPLRGNRDEKQGRTLWPPEQSTRYDDYLDDDYLNFNDY
jgi:hypothetical protein